MKRAWDVTCILLALTFVALVPVGLVMAANTKRQVELARKTGEVKEMLPVKMMNPKGLPFNEIELRLIHRAVIRATQKRLNPTNPPKLEPNVTLVLGAEAPGINTELNHKTLNPESTIYLPTWDSGQFAMGMTIAVTNQIFSGQEIVNIANEAMGSVRKQAPTSVEELKK